MDRDFMPEHVEQMKKEQNSMNQEDLDRLQNEDKNKVISKCRLGVYDPNPREAVRKRIIEALGEASNQDLRKIWEFLRLPPDDETISRLENEDC